MANIELLDRTLAHIKAHPEEWKQELWVCRTAACFAGWAVALDRGWGVHELNVQFWDGPHGLGWIRSAAIDALAITNEQAGDLFWSGNSISELTRIVDEIAGRS